MIDVGVRPSEPGDLAPPTDMDMGGETDTMPEPGAESPISGAENAPAGGGAPAPLTPV